MVPKISVTTALSHSVAFVEKKGVDGGRAPCLVAPPMFACKTAKDLITPHRAHFSTQMLYPGVGDGHGFNGRAPTRYPEVAGRQGTRRALCENGGGRGEVIG